MTEGSFFEPYTKQAVEVEDLSEQLPSMTRLEVPILYTESSTLYAGIADHIKDGVYDGNPLEPLAVICNAGVVRSRELKLLAYDLNWPIALTNSDKTKLTQRSQMPVFAQIGMSFRDMAERVNNGTVINQQLHPQGLDRPIKTIIGFVAGLYETPALVGLDKAIGTVADANHVQKLDLQLILVNDLTHAQTIKKIREEKGVKIR